MDLLLVDIGFVVADDGHGAGEPYTYPFGIGFFPRGGGDKNFVKDRNIGLPKKLSPPVRGGGVGWDKIELLENHTRIWLPLC